MKTYHLAVFWEWIYDEAFNALLNEVASQKEVSLFFVDPQSLASVIQKIEEKEIRFLWYLDRASESDNKFLPLVQTCQLFKFKSINPFSKVRKALNKAYMHRVLKNFSIPLPETIILPPISKKRDLPPFTFAKTGIPFILKPANGGGGDGVHLGLTELREVQLFRNEFPNDEYLIQQTIVPVCLHQVPLWFRAYFVCGKIFYFLWNPQTKIFSLPEEPHLKPVLEKKIRSIVLKIAQVSKLQFFSSEIAVTEKEKPIVIDYVNDPVDLRTKPLHADGIPEHLLQDIVFSLIRFVKPFP